MNDWISVKYAMPPPVTRVLVYSHCCDVCHDVEVAEWEQGSGWFKSGGEDLGFTPEFWKTIDLPVFEDAIVEPQLTFPS